MTTSDPLAQFLKHFNETVLQVKADLNAAKAAGDENPDLSKVLLRQITELRRNLAEMTKSRDEWKQVAESLEWQLKQQIALRQERK